MSSKEKNKWDFDFCIVEKWLKNAGISYIQRLLFFFFVFVCYPFFLMYVIQLCPVPLCYNMHS